jgi:hypothetical protein
MYSKEYFLSLIAASFLTQIDIPLSLLQDEEAVALIIKYKWQINTNISDYNWATLVKTGLYHD